jgi:hypothetical protein
MEKAWVTQDCWFWLHTTCVGMNATATFRLSGHHDLISNGNYPINIFAGVLTYQLIGFAKTLDLAIPRCLFSSIRYHSPLIHEVTANTPSPCTLVMSTPSAIIPQHALFSLISLMHMNSDEHHCTPYDKEQDKKGDADKVPTVLCLQAGWQTRHFVGSFVSAARSPSAFQATSSLVIASSSMPRIADASVGVEAALEQPRGALRREGYSNG